MLTRMHLMSSHIDVFFVYISSHAKVSDLAHFIITHQYVPSSQITMDDLNSKQKRLDISSVRSPRVIAGGKLQSRVES